MNQAEIAKTHKVSEALVSRIKRNKDRFTDNIDLAVDIAALTGKKPIVYIKPSIQKLALAAHPELNAVHVCKSKVKA